jgi:hypothetical protein
MDKKLSIIVSVVSLAIAIGTLIFSLGYYKAKLDRIIEINDVKAEKLRTEHIVNEALDKRLKTIMQYFKNRDNNDSTGSQQSTTAQELPAEVLEIEEPRSGTTITGSIIRVSGSHSLPLSAHVWILLGDAYGNFYLQNPPVILRRDGRWSATNIRPGQGITAIHAVYVDTAGHERFLEMVRKNQWAGFPQLPASARILDTVDITRN